MNIIYIPVDQKVQLLKMHANSTEIMKLLINYDQLYIHTDRGPLFFVLNIYSSCEMAVDLDGSIKYWL